MKLLAFVLLLQPAVAQVLIVNAADGSATNFAPGSLILTTSSTLLPVIATVSEGIYLVRLPIDLPLGPTTRYGPSINIVPNSFAIFSGNISAFVSAYSSGLSSFTAIVMQPSSHFAQKNNGPWVGLTQPAHPGEYLTIYGTGLGSAAPDQISVSIAGLIVPVTYAGPAPGEAGVDQINVFIPPDLPAPDSCYDSFVVTVAGTTVAPKALPYTKNSATCASPIGFTTAELARIDAGLQVPFVQLSVQSAIRPAVSYDNVGTGFTRSEFAQAFEPFGIPFPNLIVADSIMYSCKSLIAVLTLYPNFDGAYQGLSIAMGSASIPVGPGLPYPPLPSAVPAPDALPPALVQPGTWLLTAPNFSRPVQIPPPTLLQNFSSLQSIDTTQDLTITWNPAGYSASDVFTLSIAASPSPYYASYSSTCNAPATVGTLIVPAAQLRLIPAKANITASAAPHPDQTPNFRLPQPDGTTLPLQFTYHFSETFPVTLH